LNAARYRVDRELAAGGVATVCLAEDIRHDRKVALKVLKPTAGWRLCIARKISSTRDALRSRC
jgi:hypothetical protein